MNTPVTKSISVHRRSAATQQGVSLIEVLVSVLILSVGLLGVAGLQAAVAKYKINTWSRAAISTLYADLADRVRMNSDVAGANFITGISEPSLYVLSGTWSTQQAATLTTPSPNCETASCTTAERAAYDMSIWRQRVRAGLPQGAALISGDRRDGINMTLMWFDKGFTDKGQASDSTLVSALACTGAETGMARQSCCPAASSAPVGVRCANFSFIP
ncbi:MAG: type IV pilus modification protein PilV [Rhodoferax sp.]